jgi:pimeloyl-ACP methyl ester carboxylesterase
MSEGTLELDGATLCYRDRGAGQPILLIHGGLGSGAEWDPLVARLEDEFRLIAPDSRAHGRSTNDGRQLSYPLLADDAALLIEALGLERPVVVGWSDGGQVAMELAVRHIGVASALVVGGAYPEFAGSGLREIHRGLAKSLVEGQPDDELQELAATHAEWEELLRQTSSMWARYDGLAAAELEKLAIPALVLAADHDQLVSLDLSVALFGELAGSELAVIAGTDHESIVSEAHAEKLAVTIRDFVTRRASRARVTT